MKQHYLRSRRFVCVAMAAAIILSACTGMQQSPTSLPDAAAKPSVETASQAVENANRSQHRGHARPADTGQYTKNTVLSKSDHNWDTLLVVGEKSNYFFASSGRKVTYSAPHLLVRDFGSLWTFTCSKVVQIRYLYQPITVDLSCNSFGKEQNSVLLAALAAASSSELPSVCADCDFPVAFNFQEQSPYGNEVQPTDPPETPGPPDCSSGLCSGSQPTLVTQPAPPALGLGSTSPCPFPQVWIYSPVLQSCVSGSTTGKADYFLAGLATGYDWSKTQQTSYLYWTSPCCFTCYYYTYYGECGDGYYPDDYWSAYYLDYTGQHIHGSGWFPFQPGGNYVNKVGPSATQYSDDLNLFVWGGTTIGNYFNYALADGAKPIQ